MHVEQKYILYQILKPMKEENDIDLLPILFSKMEKLYFNARCGSWKMIIGQIVAGVNRGIGFEIVFQLACKGMTVVLTCHNEKNGLAAMKELSEGVENVHFHILDV